MMVMKNDFPDLKFFDKKSNCVPYDMFTKVFVVDKDIFVNDNEC